MPVANTHDQDHLLNRLRLLAERLERLSADSTWARRASGIRGGILKAIEELEQAKRTGRPMESGQLDRLDALINLGFEMLCRAAIELIE